MANPEHLKILEKGVKAWNKWRKENPGIRPDLSDANLSGAFLYEADLRGANLRAANLGRTNLSRAILERADLSDTGLSYTLLNRANLHEANLKGANLVGAELVDSNLSRANLSKANIGDAFLWDINLEKANLTNSDMRLCTLVRINLSSAILTGAQMYGTVREDWNIKNVKCKYVYWDIEGEQRSPKDRDLEPGEFERLYAALPTIEYIFENGMTPIDPLIMDRVVQAIREKRPEFDIKIDSINARGLAPSIKFTVQHEEHKEPALEEVRKGYDGRISRLESEKDRLYDLLGQAIDKDSVKLITAGPGAIVATDGSTVNIQQHIHNTLELQKAIANEPEDSKSFAKIAKKTAMDIIGEATKDIAKGQVKEAAKQIIELGKDLGPIIVKTAAYGFFKSMLL